MRRRGRRCYSALAVSADRPPTPAGAEDEALRWLARRPLTEAEVCGKQRLRLTFNDGTRKVVDVEPILQGPIFERLHNH